MSEQRDRISRTVLPIPDRADPGLMTYDAKDPDTRFPPIELDAISKKPLTASSSATWRAAGESQMRRPRQGGGLTPA
jgi:hypothetical protein